jgi:hypothetical protein
VRQRAADPRAARAAARGGPRRAPRRVPHNSLTPRRGVAAGFRQRVPREGAAATRATSVRVLVDGAALYPLTWGLEFERLIVRHGEPSQWALAGAWRFTALGEVADPAAPRSADRARPLAPASLRADGARWVAHPDDPARRYAFDRPDFATRAPNANLVLRWDYRRGSTFFLVWAHGRAADDPADVAAGRAWGDGTRRLWTTPGANEIIVKVSHWLAR